MSLVSYAYSDSEAESDNDKTEKTEEKDLSIVELFSTLPQPKKGLLNLQEENDDLFNKTLKEQKIPKKAKKDVVKISIPALSSYNSDEEDVPKKITKPAPKATGLFAVLPAPKTVPVEADSKFSASIVKQKNLVPRSLTKVGQNKSAPKKTVDSDEEDVKEGEHFFSSIFTYNKLSEVQTSSLISGQVDSAKPVKDILSKTNQYFANLVSQPAIPETEEPTESNDNISGLDENAYKELCGNRRKRLKKDQDIQIIDINATDIMPDPRDWRTKTLTEEAPATSVKKGEEPSLQSRRKHQITYLAYQAKQNEQDLKNQWALNRVSRKQTQAKYGF